MVYAGQGRDGESARNYDEQGTGTESISRLVYGHKGYLALGEYNQVEQIKQFYQYLQSQKIQVDQNLWNEIIKHHRKDDSKGIRELNGSRCWSRDKAERCFAQFKSPTIGRGNRWSLIRSA